MRNLVLLFAVATSLGAGQAESAQPEQSKAAAGKPVLVLEAGMHLDQIAELLFTADGKRLISVSGDKTIRFWDAAKGELVKVLRPPMGLGYDGRLRAAALSPDGRLLAVGGYGMREKDKRKYPTFVIDLSKEAIVHVIPGGAAPVYALAFSPDGKRLAAAGYNEGTIRIADVAGGRQEMVLEMMNNQEPKRLVFSPDGKYLAATTLGGGFLHMFHLPTGKAGVTPDTLGPTFDIAWSPDGKTMATANTIGLGLWNADGGLRRVDFRERPCYAVRFTPDSRKALVEAKPDDGEHNRAFWVDLATAKETLINTESGTNLALSPDGSLLAGLSKSGSAGAAIFCCKSDTGESLFKLPMGGAKQPLNRDDVGWSADGRTFSLARYASFDFVKLAAGPPLNPMELQSPVMRLGDMELKPAGATRFEILKKGQLVALVKAESQGGFPAYSFMGPERIVAGNNHGDLQLRRSADGVLLRSCPAHNDSIRAVAPSPNGKVVASFGVRERIVALWNLENDRPLLYVRIVVDKTKKEYVYDWLAWTPEGHYACSPAAASWFGWHLDRGPQQMAGYAKGPELRETYHRPDLVRKAVERFLGK